MVDSQSGARVQVALSSYRQNGLSEPEDEDTAAADLLADMLHHFGAEPFAWVLERAQDYHRAETVPVPPAPAVAAT